MKAPISDSQVEAALDLLDADGTQYDYDGGDFVHVPHVLCSDWTSITVTPDSVTRYLESREAVAMEIAQ